MRRLAAGAVLAFSLIAAACDRGSSGGPPVPTTTPPPEGSPSPVETGPGSAEAARGELCEVPPPSGETVSTEGPIPPAIAEIQREVEEVRGLAFTERVAVDPITQEEMVSELREGFDETYPDEQYERRSIAWQTIGVIPEGTSIRGEIEEFAEGQVVGFYVPATGQLVYIGEEDPSPLSHVVLAHELTHALDDQHFGLRRLDGFAERCADERLMAALGVVEGSAQLYSVKVATRFLTPSEALEVVEEAGSAPLPDVPEFILRLETWPYDAGFAFVSRREAEGGTEAVNAALEELPVSTEQVLHPERYPNDVPTPIGVDDLAPALGDGWEDLDVMDVGEAWLRLMLDDRLDAEVAERAAAGWDGGIYRAWRNGGDVALVMSTVWDTPEDAAAFADAVLEWVEGESAEVGEPDGSAVTVLFASDDATLEALGDAIAA
jgi:hypothetical protein